MPPPENLRGMWRNAFYSTHVNYLLSLWRELDETDFNKKKEFILGCFNYINRNNNKVSRVIDGVRNNKKKQKNVTLALL